MSTKGFNLETLTYMIGKLKEYARSIGAGITNTYDPQGKATDIFAYADEKLPLSGGEVDGALNLSAENGEITFDGELERVQTNSYGSSWTTTQRDNVFKIRTSALESVISGETPDEIQNGYEPMSCVLYIEGAASYAKFMQTNLDFFMRGKGIHDLANPVNDHDAVNKLYVDSHGVPSVTEEDNGKVLRVVDGAWTAQKLVNAEEVYY